MSSLDIHPLEAGSNSTNCAGFAPVRFPLCKAHILEIQRFLITSVKGLQIDNGELQAADCSSVSDLRDQVERTIQAQRLFRSGQAVLVAVSGGVDSMVLLHLLHELVPTYGWRLTVAHLNHRLRGRSSAADEQLVRRVAGEMGLPIIVEHAEVRSFARERGLSLEMAARELRHAFLARAAVERGIRKVALAHHADDQLELFFLRLFRGSGGYGLGGMKWHGPSPSNPSIELVRPLLEQTKAALEAHAREAGIEFREDASNACPDIQRNRVRHELLPSLRKAYQPALDKIISRVMDILSAEADLAKQIAADWLSHHKRDGNPRHEKPVHLVDSSLDSLLAHVPFEKLHVAVQRRCLQMQMIGLGLTADYETLEQLRKVPNRPLWVTGAAQNLASGDSKDKAVPKLNCPTEGLGALERKSGPAVVFRDLEGKVRVRQAVSKAFRHGSLQVDLAAPRGEIVFEEVRFRWRISGSPSRAMTKLPRTGEIFDADQVGSPVTLRHWQPGDRFQPIGLSSSVKLQDFFVNRKVPSARRRELILGLTVKGEVFWVEGMRISERFKLTESTTRGLHWQWRRP